MPTKSLFGQVPKKVSTNKDGLVDIKKHQSEVNSTIKIKKQGSTRKMFDGTTSLSPVNKKTPEHRDYSDKTVGASRAN